MDINVEITIREHGQVVGRRDGHNIWVDTGREYLAQAISFTSPINSTPEGSVDLVAAFPALTNQFFYIRLGHAVGIVEYRVQLASPADSTELLAQINAQAVGIVASLGGGNGIVFTPASATSIEIVGGSALSLLGLSPVVVSAAGMTTTPLDDRRIKFMGFGIGSKFQSVLATSAPLSTAYPPGSDPNATAGNEYNRQFPLAPPITSLELPVRVSGGTDPYPGDPADVWLLEAPMFSNFIAGVGVVKFRGVVDGSNSEMVYAPFTTIPLTEVGLFLSDSDVNDAYNAGKLVAYHSFGTIQLTAVTQIELIWTVSF